MIFFISGDDKTTMSVGFSYWGEVYYYFFYADLQFSLGGKYNRGKNLIDLLYFEGENPLTTSTE